MSGRWVKAAGLTAGATLVAMAGLGVPAGAVSSGTPGDPTIVLDVNDSAAGGTYEETFKQVYAGTTPDGHRRAHLRPERVRPRLGADGRALSMDPLTDWNPGDEFVPCADELRRRLRPHPGPDRRTSATSWPTTSWRSTRTTSARWARPSPAVPGERRARDDRLRPPRRGDVRLRGDHLHRRLLRAGLHRQRGHERDRRRRVRLGQPHRRPDGQRRNGRSELYEGVVAHELEHLLHNYSDPGELSWVDEGLADLAIFFNGYDVGGSHLTYHQVFHRETSLTRWGGGLENYGASYTFFQYLWEQAGGNGDGTYRPGPASTTARPATC